MFVDYIHSARVSLVSSRLTLITWRLMERCAEEANILPAAERETDDVRKRGGGKLSYPFHAFQIALQQRVQSEDHIVAEALELEDAQRTWRRVTAERSLCSRSLITRTHD